MGILARRVQEVMLRRVREAKARQELANRILREDKARHSKITERALMELLDACNRASVDSLFVEEVKHTLTPAEAVLVKASRCLRTEKRRLPFDMMSTTSSLSSSSHSSSSE